MALLATSPPSLSEPHEPVEEELNRYFAVLGTRLWDRRQRHNFATYAIGLMSELERKSLEPIAASFTHDPKEAERLHYRLQNLLADAPWPTVPSAAIAGEKGAGDGFGVCLPLRTCVSPTTLPGSCCG